MESFERFNEDQFPSKEAIYSSLKAESISNKDYRHTQDDFRSFRMVELGDYNNLWLLTDVLTVVFESFTDM